jgi:acyl carrier protein
MGEPKMALRRAQFSRLGPRVRVDDDTEPFSLGLVDSLDVVERVTLVEEELERAIPAADRMLQDFDSVGRIVRLAEKPGGSA